MINFKIPTTFLLLVIFVLSQAAMAGDETDVDMAIEKHSVFLDYGSDVYGTVEMQGDTYYIVQYKNILPFASGIEILDSNGELVEDKSTLTNVLKAVTWKKALNEMTTKDFKELDEVLQSYVIVGQESQNIRSISSMLLIERSELESDTIDYDTALRIDTELKQVNEGLVELYESSSEALESLKTSQQIFLDTYSDVDKQQKQLESALSARQNLNVSMVLGTLSIIFLLIMALILARSARGLIFADRSSFKKGFTISSLAPKLSKKKNATGQLSSPNPQDRARAAFMIGFSDNIDDGTVMELIPLLTDENVTVRSNTAKTLFRIGEKNPKYIEMAGPDLKIAMSDSDEAVRKNATDAYALLGDISVEDIVEHVASEPQIEDYTVTQEDNVLSVPEDEIVLTERKYDVNNKEVLVPDITARSGMENTDVSKSLLSEEMMKKLGDIRSDVSRCTDIFPHSCDMCIPQYLQNICIATLDIAARSGDEQFVKAAAKLCEGVERQMKDGRLADICIAGKFEDFDPKAYEVDTPQYLSKIGKDDLDYQYVEKRLFDVDSTITQNMNDIDIIPVVGIWKIAKSLIDNSQNELEPYAFLFLANLILDRVAYMMEDPQIMKRLAR